MKKMLLVFALMLMSVFTVFAADNAAEKTKLIEELLMLTKQEEMLKTNFAMVRDTQKRMMPQLLEQKGITLSAEEKKKSDEILAATMKIIEDEFSWDKLRPVIVNVYADNLSVDTLKGLNAFYKTPAGQEFLTKMPAIQQQLMNGIQQPILEMSKKLDAKIAEFAAQEGAKK